MNTHPEQWAAIYAVVPAEQLGFGVLLKGGSVMVIEGGESTVHSLPPTSNSCQTWYSNRNLSIKSPAL